MKNKSEAGYSFDDQFASFLLRLSPGGSEILHQLFSLLSRTSRSGNICLDLSLPSREYADLYDENDQPSFMTLTDFLPLSKNNHRALLHCPLISGGEKLSPVVLKNNRLYLHRYYQYENILIEKVRARLERGNGFAVISGGPGTGKTTLVWKILRSLLTERGDLRVNLAAPTGKAALRIRESLLASENTVTGSGAADVALKEKITQLAENTGTLHRLLGSIPNSPEFRHNTENPLALDLLIIDECSMVDIPLMAKTLLALEDSAALILIGDPDQLASVESGAFFGDLCSAAGGNSTGPEFLKSFMEKRITIAAKEKTSPKKKGVRGQLALFTEQTPENTTSDISRVLVRLTQNFRFKNESGIARLSAVLSEKDGQGGKEALNIFREGPGELKWNELSDIKKTLPEKILDCFKDFHKNTGPDNLLDIMDRLRILCAHSRGRQGAGEINRLVQNILLESGRLRRTEDSWMTDVAPVMIRKNDYSLKLFNGDTGIIAGGYPRKAYFRSVKDGKSRLREIAADRLPDHEVCFAMTVHKSQGSEFDRVILILPDRISPVLTAELLYTAVTRTRKYFEIFAPEDVFLEAASRRIRRPSGIVEAFQDK